MKVAAYVFLFAALLLVLTWLNMRGVNADWQGAQDGLEDLDRLALAESTLHRDLLRARDGILQNYDLLVARVDQLRRVVSDLRAHAVGEQELGAVERLGRLVDQEEALTEQFKSWNALLHNSLTYFGLYSTRLSGPDQPPELARAVSGLSTAMLYLTLHTSLGTADADRWLRTLSPAELRFPNVQGVDALGAHGQLLRDLLPATDRLLAALFAVPSDEARMSARSLIRSRQNASADNARISQYLMYAISVVLVVLLGYLARGLQLRAETLRHRAELEHVIATCSTHLINSTGIDIARSVEHALAELARLLGANRAYFTLRGTGETHCWSDRLEPPPEGWIGTVLAAVPEFESKAASVIHLDLTTAEQMERTFLIEHELQGWICVAYSGPGAMDAILGFDFLEHPPLFSASEAASLRMAFDAIANALAREVIEGERRQLEASLHHAQRIETVGVLTSGIAHNFNNVIGAILGNAERAAMRAQPGSPIADLIDQIHRAADRARDLIDQILTFGRRRGLSPVWISVDALIAEAQSLLKGSHHIENDLLVAENSAGATVLGEAALLQQVIINLCVNAAQAMDTASPIRLETNVRSTQEALRLSQGQISPGKYVVISVEDTGKGMDPQTLARSFEPFFTTKEAGNGLGLATAREIVLQHGGAIDVWSAIDVGTRFDVWLPAAPGTQLTQGSSDWHRGRGQTVLIVTDQKDCLARTEEIVAALGYEPIGILGIETAVGIYRNSPTRFDAALIALGEPIERTQRAIAMIKQIAPELPILAAVTNCSEYRFTILARARVEQVLRYPISPPGLAAALARLFAEANTLALPAPLSEKALKAAAR